MTPLALAHHPLTALIVTIGSFVAAQNIQQKAGGHSLINPSIIAILTSAAYVALSGLPYKEYLHNVSLIHELLKFVPVALAVPLYKQLPLIKQSKAGILTAVISATIVAPLIAFLIAKGLNTDEAAQMAILTKSTSTSIAISIAGTIKADPSLAAMFVFFTGIPGTLLAAYIFKATRIKSERAIGLALGTACHGLGLVRAFQISEKAGAFAALGMSLIGLISGILIPLAVAAFLS